MLNNAYIRTKLTLEEKKEKIQVFVIAEKINKNICVNAYLSERELKRLMSIKQELDRQRFVIARRRLKLFLGGKLDCDPTEIVINQSCPDCNLYHGRPSIDGAAEWNVSISHSGDWVVVAICKNYSLGVDVEKLKKFQYKEKLLTFILHSHEYIQYHHIEKYKQAMFLLKKWVRKEAVLKMHGAGLRLPPADICINDESQSIEVLKWENSVFDVSNIGLIDVKLNQDYWCSIAVAKKTCSKIELKKYIIVT